MQSRIKGKFTFQTAGVLFVLSALLELFSINSPIPLFGNIRGGVIAATYHLKYVLLFSLLGFGLFRAKSWAYPLVFVSTGLYTKVYKCKVKSVSIRENPCPIYLQR